MTLGYVNTYLPKHPLAGKYGYVALHRAVLHDAIGPGRHACHWCGILLEWKALGVPGDDSVKPLHVDHVDGNVKNNLATNLVPSCTGCNTKRGGNPAAIRPDEVHVIRASGHRLRASERTCLYCGVGFRAELSSEKVYCTRFCADAARRMEEACGKGHPRTDENTYFWRGLRRCRPCQKAVELRYKQRKRALAMGATPPTS